MAKIYIRRIAEKLNIKQKDVKGQSYQKLMSGVIAKNSGNISRAVGRLNNQSYREQIAKLRKKGRGKEKVVLLPDMDKVLPKRSVTITKSAESGREITQTLADRMTKALRDTLREFKASGQSLEIQRGPKAGQMNPALTKKFQEALREVFKGYTKIDPSIGVPPNIRNIAVTESRRVINETKKAYQQELQRKNPDTIKMTKEWRQNRGLSKEPRPEHAEVDGLKIEFNELFRVPSSKGGYYMMDGPHDPTAPADAVIGCSCDLVYRSELI